nr:immunoglobulin heavy chain junction region [Macaca mulatta]MOV53695.1 immunoglobulin heavy chain junction region [Macaca mulatta]MOV54154.1 immunoglobulin heavy chain junction region [Macaca mulatta]MOV56198.1 immunoglobulin heavy chain junction region [Macaca mulatta]MOV56457.1 immunoglobulin heavy chain junction region [Macaca mulatta]
CATVGDSQYSTEYFEFW